MRGKLLDLNPEELVAFILRLLTQIYRYIERQIVRQYDSLFAFVGDPVIDRYPMILKMFVVKTPRYQ